MADEIKVRFSLSVEKGFFKDEVNLGQLDVDQGSPGGRGGYVQEIGTVEELLDFGDVGAGTLSNEGFLYLRNLDATNYVNFGPDIGTTGAGQLSGKLKAGEFAFFRIEPNTAWYAKADTASVLLDVRLYSD